MSYPPFHWSSTDGPPIVLTEADFGRLFPGEGDHLEFKQGLSLDRVRETVTAFSNADGGVIVIGVDDEGNVRGHTLDGDAKAKIHRLVSEVHSPGRYDVRSVPVGEHPVTFLAVDRRREGFAQTPDSAILVRRGASNVRLFGADLSSFLSKRKLTRFETTPTDMALVDADPVLLDTLAEVWGWDDEESYVERLVERGLAERARDGVVLTVAGVLYLAQDASGILGKPVIEIFRYRDRSVTYDKRTPIAGPLQRQVEAATDAVMDELGAEQVVLGLHRYELERIPRAVLREAIANAVAHRDYESLGTATRIEVRPDRVLIVSPGGLPEPVTVANIRDQQAARNRTVIDTLRRFRLAEDAGQGVDLMQDSMRANMLQPPLFVDTGESVTVELQIGSSVAPVERAWLIELEQRGEIAPQERVVLVHAARGEILTNATIRDLLAIDSVEARATLQRLRDAGFLVQSGSRGGASYRLAGDLAPPAGLRLGRDELADLVEELANSEPVTNAMVRARTGLDRASASRLLKELVEQGRLQMVGSRRGARYVPRSTDETLPAH